MNQYIKGLSSQQAKLHLEKHGQNSISIKSKQSIFKEILIELVNPMSLILVGATIISILSGELIDAGIIGFIIVLNTFLSIFQKHKADKAIEKLQSLVNPKTKVYRDGKLIEIDSIYIVPDDIIKLSEGDLIPADGIIIDSKQFYVQESTLTGESVPIQKIKDSQIFMGTQVVQGQANCLIQATGLQTEFGKIANLTSQTKKDLSPLQKEIKQISKIIGYFMIAFSVIFLVVSILKEGTDSILQNIIFAASIAVAAVPEGLPTTITLSLSIGVQKLADKGSIIKSLSSVETLGSTDIIVSDKTGTLTKNQMTVTDLFIDNKNYKVKGIGYNPKGEILNYKEISEEKLMQQSLISLFCNDSQIYSEDGIYKVIGDPTEGALITLAEKTEFNTKFFKETKVLDTIPFNSKYKYMASLVSHNENKYLLIKGAPEVVYAMSNLTPEETQIIQTQQENLASNALRTLGLAIKHVDNNTEQINTKDLQNLNFISLIGIIDPPRQEVKQSILEAKKLGLKIIMATGDHHTTAEAIAKQIGFENIKTINGEEFNKLTDSDLQELILSNKDLIFARVKPEDKLRIVNSCKELGKIVAVTGDGVNDAPALKRADIGIAMGINGTEVSKEAADMILTKDDFTDIIVAIKEGRNIYQNIQKFIAYLFSCNAGEILCLGISFILGFPLPLTAILLLVINLGTDILPAISLSFEHNSNIIKKHTEKIIDRTVKQKILVQGLTIGALSFTIFYFIVHKQGDLPLAITYCFTTLVIAQMVNVINTKDLLKSIFSTNLVENRYMLYSIFISMTILILCIKTDLANQILKTVNIPNTNLLILTLGIIAVITTINEFNKLILRINSK